MKEMRENFATRQEPRTYDICDYLTRHNFDVEETVSLEVIKMARIKVLYYNVFNWTDVTKK